MFSAVLCITLFGCDDEALNETQESVVEEIQMATTYEAVIEGSIQTGNPHRNTIQTFTYFYYAITDGSTPSKETVEDILAEIFGELNLETQETEAYGIFLWPNIETAQANILGDGDWELVYLPTNNALISSAAGIIMNTRFVSDSNYWFFYYGDNGNYEFGNWYFDGERRIFSTMYA